MEFLGYKFTPDKHVKAVQTYQTPKSTKDVRVYLGLVNFFMKHIPQRAELTKPMNELTKKNALFKWAPECQAAFEKLNKILTSAPVLRYPRFREKFYLSCDASTTSIGACLSQNHKLSSTRRLLWQSSQ